jgi:predicted nucleotidyltransferase
MRTIPADLDPSALKAIDERLAAIRADEHVSILLAVESGSRAWGFPSPDSDYDCRFIYVRRSNDYLSPWPKRDVIEDDPTGDLDVNGWDLGKALKLMLKGNAIVLEWLRSPIVYEGRAVFIDRIANLARAHANRDAIARHYLHLGEGQRRTYFANEKQVRLKKLFYALRPAAALRWLRFHPSEPVPPMHFPTLMAECDPPAIVQRLSDELIAQKLQTRELGEAPLPPPIKDFVDSEFALGREWIPERSKRLSSSAVFEAEALFRDAVASDNSTRSG